MKTTAALLLATAMLAGCSTTHLRRVPPRFEQRLSNAEAYDAYVVRRTDELAVGGAMSRNKASAIADAEATRRFGPRTNADSAPSARWAWTTDHSHSLSLAELDATVDAMKKDGGR